MILVVEAEVSHPRHRLSGSTVENFQAGLLNWVRGHDANCQVKQLNGVYPFGVPTCSFEHYVSYIIEAV